MLGIKPGTLSSVGRHASDWSKQSAKSGVNILLGAPIDFYSSQRFRDHPCESNYRVETKFVKTTLSTPDRDANLNHPVIGSLVYYESSALDHVVTKMNSTWQLHTFLLLFLVILNREAARILGIFGHNGKSHFDVFEPLVVALSKRGHDVVVASHFPQKISLTNYTDISLEGSVENNGTDAITLEKIDKHSQWIISPMQTIFGQKNCEAVFQYLPIQILLKSDEKFDLLISELFNTDCYLGFVHKFKVPHISLSSHVLMPWANGRVGNPDNPGYIPHLFSLEPQKMDLLQRIMNTVSLFYHKLVYSLLASRWNQAIISEWFVGSPALDDIRRNTSLILVNSHFSVNGARPLVPGVVEVGGLHIRQPKKLPEPVVSSSEHFEQPSVSSSDHFEQPSVSSLDHFEQPGVSSSDHFEQPSVSSLDHFEQPGVSSSDHFEQPSVSSLDHFEQPGISISDNFEQPGISISDNFEQPGVSSLDHFEQPSVSSLDHFEQPCVSSLDHFEQPGISISDNFEQPGVSISDNFEQPGVSISDNFEQPEVPNRLSDAPKPTDSKDRTRVQPAEERREFRVRPRVASGRFYIVLGPTRSFDCYDLDKFISEAKHGVVYFSMGSMIRAEKRRAFLEAFSELPQRVLWKWEGDELPDKPDNVLTQKWMPQFDILSHTKVLAYMSHCGNLGSLEAASAGVPVVGLPMYGDQFNNARSLEQAGMAVILRYGDVTKSTVLQALRAVLDHPRDMDEEDPLLLNQEWQAELFSMAR
uniref:Uncharacterized protein n=1 Tax=Timema monikensis TaxID=170555 RepID=A0A7R9EHG2_9NEOP|nr:unnamed protein product [Timema monikensis]